MKVPEFQSKVGIPVVQLEVFEALAVVALDSIPIILIDGVFGDVRKVLWVFEYILEFF